MNTLHFHKNRIIWLVIVVFISSGLVGVALAAVSNTSRSITGPQAAPAQSQGESQTEPSAPPSPDFRLSDPTSSFKQLDTTGEQMRLQAMSASQAQDRNSQQDHTGYVTDADSDTVAPSMAPSGAGTDYLPGGIVVDSYLDCIYGNVALSGKVTVTRLSDGAYGSAEADDVGYFWTSLFDGAGGGFPVDIIAGDELIISVDGSPAAFTVGDEPGGEVDVGDDSLSGNIPGVPSGTMVTVTLGLYAEPSLAYGIYSTLTDGSGNFAIDFALDIGPENFAIVDFKLGEFTQRTSLFPENVFLLRQNSQIAGYAPRGSDIHATVYQGNSDIPRAEADAKAEGPYGWFLIGMIEMAPGDKVTLDFTTGSTTMVYVYASSFTFSGDDTVLGLTDPNTMLRVSFLAWDGTQYIYNETHALADGSGNFTASFPGGGIRPDMRLDVAILDPSGAGSYMFTGRPYVEAIRSFDSDNDCVWGRVDVPNADLSLSLIRAGIEYPRQRPMDPSDPGNQAGGDYCYLVWYDFNDGQGMRPINFESGDILRLSSPSWIGEVTIVEPHWVAQATDNLIEGEIFSGQTGEVAVRVYSSDYTFLSHGTAAEARAQANPGFVIPFNDFDVRAGIFVSTYFYDPLTGFANQFSERNHYFQTLGDIAVWGHSVPSEGITVTLLLSDTLEPVCFDTEDLDQNPVYFYFDLSECPLSPPLQPGYIVEVAYQWHYSGDWWMLYTPVSVQADPDIDMIFAEAPDGMLELTAGFDQVSFDQMAPTNDSQAAVSTAFFGYDLGWGDLVEMYSRDASGNYLSNSTLTGEIRRVEFWFNPNGYTSIWGNAEPNHPVIVKTSRGDTLSSWAGFDGNFGTDHSTLLYPGDLITVTAGLGNYPVIITIPDMGANSDSTNEMVNGHIGLPDWSVEIYPWWNEPVTTTVTDIDGKFTANFIDIPPQGRGYIRFAEEVGPTAVDAVFHRPFYDLQPAPQVNYAHDWVEGQYDPGYQIWITVTTELKAIKATAHGITGDIPWWGGETGFSTDDNVVWDGVRPDLQTGDTVNIALENGRTASVKAGEISGILDINADTFQGTLDIPWLADPVDGDCGVWVEGGPGMGFNDVDPNGGTFTCDFTTLGWDIIPGEDIGVGYYEPDGDKVYNVFNQPAPDLRIDTRGQGQPGYGNNYVLEVHFNNDGWATAPDVTIAQEFDGLSYLSDTSGFSHTGSGNPGDPIIWQVGDLPYNHNSESFFYVFLQVVNPPGNSVSTVVDIATSLAYYQGDEGRKHSEWSADVVENDSDLAANKWAWTGDPVPGQDFVYSVQVCNNGSTDSTEVFITDTLPVTITLVNWWGQFPGWEEVSASDHQLVVKRPSAQGNWCGEVYINVNMSEQAQEGMLLLNEAWIWSSSDVDPTNNYANTEVKVGSPRYNLHLQPNWVQGQFVPGGEVSFEFNFTNWGNMPMPGTVLTSTLPAGTEFLFAYHYDWNGWAPFTPTLVTDDYVVFAEGMFPGGYNSNIGLRLKIADDTLPGTPLMVENTIMGDALEERYDDNVLVFNEMVNEPGPNLRVDKHTNWRWNWEGELQYELRILNVGTQYLENVVITDTYPVSTTYNNCWWNHGKAYQQSCTWDDATHQAVFRLDFLDPGETASAELVVDLATQDVGVQGLVFVNQADISDYGDVAPQDNHDQVTSYTGPDVFVRKWLKQGELRAGELITYTVEFGNLNRWPWNGDQNFGSHITDTLPVGMTFVKAIPYWDATNTWEPESINGQQVVWGWGTMWSEGTWTFDLVVQIDDDVMLGQELVNIIDAWGDSPKDIDINPLNNHFEYPVNLILYRMLMPLAQRSP